MSLKKELGQDSLTELTPQLDHDTAFVEKLAAHTREYFRNNNVPILPGQPLEVRKGETRVLSAAEITQGLNFPAEVINCLTATFGRSLEITLPIDNLENKPLNEVSVRGQRAMTGFLFLIVRGGSGIYYCIERPVSVVDQEKQDVATVA